MGVRYLSPLLMVAVLSLVPACGGGGGGPKVSRGGGAATIETDGDRILIDGKPLFLKGIDYSPFIAGDAPWAPIKNVNFLQDLRKIKDELHANAVRIYDPLPKAFYDAARQVGLWVIQGIFLPDRPDFLAALPEMKTIVGNAIAEIYERGGADVILAYAVGNDLSTASVAATIWNNQSRPRFQGAIYKVSESADLPPLNRYVEVHEDEFCPPAPVEDFPGGVFPDPHPFQSFLAELAEHVAVLEQAPGRTSHLIGHAVTPDTNPFLGSRDRIDPKTDLPIDLSFLDIIFENISTYDHPYIAYYGLPSYLDRLKVAYPQTPVVILGIGYSTSPEGAGPPGRLCGFVDLEPLPSTMTFGGVTEQEQAEVLEERWVDTVTAARPLAGFFVYEYYDEWWLDGDPSSQNSDSQDPLRPLEYFGLMSVTGSPGNFSVRAKQAFHTVADFFGCEESDADAAACGLAIRSERLIDATYGLPVDHALAAEGGTPPYRWAIDDGALPLGVRLDADGAKIAGTPERTGAFRFRLTVRDSSPSPLSRSRFGCLRVGPPEFSTDREMREILLNGTPFFLKGIDYSNFIAGDAPWTSVVIADPVKDMKEIKEELHANAIRLYQVAPKTVYDEARKNGLFIIQGIHLQIDCPASGCPPSNDPLWESADPRELEPYDLLGPDYFPGFRAHVLSQVDEIHAFGAEDTILCYVIGNEMNFFHCHATIVRNQDRPRYEGTFYSAPDTSRLPLLDHSEGCDPPADRVWDSHPLQSMIAELADAAARREAERYGERHLTGHSTDPNMSIVPSFKHRFFPREHPPVDFGFLDIVFQNVYAYFPPVVRFLGFRKYLELCASAEGYPDTPFVVLECGYSTSPEPQFPGFCANDEFYLPACPSLPASPAPFSYCFGNNREEEQARGLSVHFREAVRRDPGSPALTAGFFVFEYYDEWWKGGPESAGQHVQDEGRPEEWFGIKQVSGERGEHGDRSKLIIRNRQAFDTVAKLFGPSGWCPDPDWASSRDSAEGVKISFASPLPFDAVTIRRDGILLVRIEKPLPASYLDPFAPVGVRTYTIIGEKDFVECPALELTLDVQLAARRSGGARRR